MLRLHEGVEWEKSPTAGGIRTHNLLLKSMGAKRAFNDNFLLVQFLTNSFFILVAFRGRGFGSVGRVCGSNPFYYSDHQDV